jgi:hypothetical protein
MFLLAFWMIAAQADVRTEIQVERVATLQEVRYTATVRDCRIVWTVHETELNRDVISHRATCGFSLKQQAPLIAALLERVLADFPEAGRFRTLAWGRILPDGSLDRTMARRLALAAWRDAGWDPARGAPRTGNLNAWTRALAQQASIFAELVPVFRARGLDLRLASVEKVLVLPAGQLPFFDQLQPEGVRPPGRVPFDFQAWFSIAPAQIE